MIFVALLIMTLADTKATAQDQCNTQSAICIFNGRLQGTILFLEQQGFGCGISANNRGLHLDIDLQGFDPGDSATAYNFRVKSFAGLLPPTCNGMGPDFGSDPRAADLGTVARSSEGRVHSSNVLHDGPTLWGDNSLLGRSVAVTRGGPNTLQQQTPDEVLDCCIIGMVSLQYPPPSPPPTSSPDLHNNDPAFTNRHDNPTANSNNPNGFNNDDNYNNNDDNGDNNSFPGPFSAPGPSFGGDAGAAGGGGAFPGGPSFSGSSFRSPFSLDSRLDLLDLSVSRGPQQGSDFSGGQSASPFTFPSPFSSSSHPPGFLDTAASTASSGNLPASGSGSLPLPTGHPLSPPGGSSQQTSGPLTQQGGGTSLGSASFSPHGSAGNPEFPSLPPQGSLGNPGFPSLPRHGSVGNPGFAGPSVQFGDLFFRGDDKDPLAGMRDTGLFNTNGNSRNTKPYENFLGVGNINQGNFYDNGNANGYGSGYGYGGYPSSGGYTPEGYNPDGAPNGENGNYDGDNNLYGDNNVPNTGNPNTNNNDKSYDGNGNIYNDDNSNNSNNGDDSSNNGASTPPANGNGNTDADPYVYQGGNITGISALER
ncbi:uncharacterized protein LOC143283456 isoform X1 [Babylonia areolata]|uniref:uncharacterized protein LOC143283456 isoform X1 n=1 Tax=Babylonia areolata TaxID=304850 RepID=UPI003FD625D0